MENRLTRITDAEGNYKTRKTRKPRVRNEWHLVKP
jgi:hypothetical protein